MGSRWPVFYLPPLSIATAHYVFNFRRQKKFQKCVSLAHEALWCRPHFTKRNRYLQVIHYRTICVRNPISGESFLKWRRNSSLLKNDVHIKRKTFVLRILRFLERCTSDIIAIKHFWTSVRICWWWNAQLDVILRRKKKPRECESWVTDTELGGDTMAGTWEGQWRVRQAIKRKISPEDLSRPRNIRKKRRKNDEGCGDEDAK